MERRIFFVHTWVHDVESFINYTDAKLEPKVDLVWDDKSPEILFATDNIYTNKRCNDIFRNMYEKAKLVVYYGSEASFTDFNLFDYGIGFDNTFKSERYIQLPIERFFRRMFKEEPLSNEELNVIENKDLKFCNFMYSNPNAHPFRDRLFYALSEYKHVDSLGAHLNNTGRGGTGFVGHYDDMVNLKRGYKFSIACENANFPGYTSEKIYTSLFARTIPIYWGNPDIEKEINPACFINCMKYNTIEEMVDAVKRVDNNDELRIKMLSAPWHTQEQKDYIEERSAQYDAFFDYIFHAPLVSLMQRRIGTYQYYYRKWFLQTRIEDSLLFRIKRKLFREKGNQIKII